MTTVFNKRPNDRFKPTSGERNLIKRIKVPILLEAVLVIAIYKSPNPV